MRLALTRHEDLLATNPAPGAVLEVEAGARADGTLTENEDAALAGNEPQIVARVTTRTPPTRGDAVNLRVDPAAVHVFDTETGARLS